MRTAKIAVLALATIAVASGRVRAADGEVVWGDWLSDAEVWRIPESGSPASPGTIPAPEPLAFAPPYPSEVVVPPVVARPTFAEAESARGRFVRYDAPLSDAAAHAAFAAWGIRGELIALPLKAGTAADSAAGKYSARVAAFFASDPEGSVDSEVRVVRYEAPADDIRLHAEVAHLPAMIVEPGLMRLPEVRFFQPKARVYMDLKRTNDEQFDLFTDGSFLASLDVVELYFPMPLFSERFARTFGRPSRLSGLGWRVGGTVGLGIATALTDGEAQGNGAPISTISAGLRYEFPLGRASDEVLQTGDLRLDQRTRVGIEGGFQGGLSTNETIEDSTDAGLYFGVLVNTPWGG